MSVVLRIAKAIEGVIKQRVKDGLVGDWILREEVGVDVGWCSEVGLLHLAEDTVINEIQAKSLVDDGVEDLTVCHPKWVVVLVKPDSKRDSVHLIERLVVLRRDGLTGAPAARVSSIN